MCSILGCLNSSHYSISSDQFSKSNTLMRRRGPDHSNINEFIFNDRFLRLGHNRRSILDLSISGNQPMFSKSKRFRVSR